MLLKGTGRLEGRTDSVCDSLPSRPRPLEVLSPGLMPPSSEGTPGSVEFALFELCGSSVQKGRRVSGRRNSALPTGLNRGTNGCGAILTLLPLPWL